MGVDWEYRGAERLGLLPEAHWLSGAAMLLVRMAGIVSVPTFTLPSFMRVFVHQPTVLSLPSCILYPDGIPVVFLWYTYDIPMVFLCYT